jgi:hypothetical protein
VKPWLFHPDYPPAPAWVRLLRRHRTEGECWIWTGTIRARGANGKGAPYGGIDHEGRAWLVHRLAYTLAYGPIPTGMQIDHTCGRTLCFNPDHLRALDAKEHQATNGQAEITRRGRHAIRSRWGHIMLQQRIFE